MAEIGQWAIPLGIVFALVGGTVFTDEHTLAQATDPNRSEGAVRKRPVGNEKRGETLYNASCIVCHGPDATGRVGPRLAGNPIVSNDQAFWTIVYEGRHIMPPLKDSLTDQQFADIQAWLKTLP